MNVLLELVQLSLAPLILLFQAERVELVFVSQGLVFFVDNLPLLLEGGDELLLLLVVHEELLSIHISLILDLHLTHKLIFVFDFLLNSLEVSWDLSEIFLLQEIPLVVTWQLWSGQDVLNGVRNDEILITHESHDWLLVLLGYSHLLLAWSLELLCYYY